MTLYALTAIPLIAFISYCLLLFAMGRRSPRKRVDYMFMLYLLSAAVWSCGSSMMRTPSALTPLFGVSLLTVGWAGTFITFYHLVRLFLEIRRQKYWLWLGYGMFTIAVGTSLIGYAAKNAYVKGGAYQHEIGPGAYLFGVYAYLCLILTMYTLLKGYREAQDQIYRSRIRYLLVGLGIVTLAGFTHLAPQMAKYPINIAANLINVLLTACVVLRCQLPSITQFVRKSLGYSFLTVLTAGVYLLIVFMLASVFRTLLDGSLIPPILVASVTAVGLGPLRDRAQLLIDRLFFREKYDAQLMLQELSKLAASILDIEELTSLLLDRLKATMHVKWACIMLKEKESARFHLITPKEQARLEEKATFREDHPVVRWLASHNRPLTHQDLDVLPQLKGLWAQEWEEMGRMEAELFIPLLVREELMGILILGPKLSEAPYSRDEQLTLTTLASQTAVAVQNAWLYSELEASLEEMKQMQAQLIQTEKLSAVGEMIAGVAHEINNPLTAIIGYSQLLQSLDLGSQVKQDLGQILEAGLRVKRIVANLLDFSRQHAPQKEYLDVNEVVSSALELRAHDLTTSGIHIETDITPDLPRTMADRHQLQQVFVNVINNAQQAMAEKGGPGVLAVSTQRGEDNTILISIEDTGPGIPPQIMGRIFDPFFTTKEVGKGTGLGLSVSYGIIQEHEGRIWAQSPAPGGRDEDGQGAIFFIQLPARDSAPADGE